MPRKGPSFFISATGADDDALTRSILWLHEQAKRLSAPALIAVFGLQALENIAGWAKTAEIFKKLKKHRLVKFDGIEIRLFIPKDSLYSWQGPVLVIHGGQKLLDKIDAISGTFPVLYLPWEGNEHQNWVATWNASDIAAPMPATVTTPPKTVDIVDVALDGLTASVNLSTGITHPSDHKQTVRVLETIYYKGVATSGEDIRQRLIRLGWQPDDAAAVAELANKVFAGRRVKDSTGKPFGRLWDYWSKRMSGEEE